MLIARTLSLAALVAASRVAATAMAQSPAADKPPAPPAATQPVNDNVLAGPGVEDAAEEGSDNMMGPGGQRRRAESLPLRQWMQQVRALDLTQQQQQEIAAILQELEQAQQTFRLEHAEQMRLVQEQIAQMRRAGREPDPALREQLQQLEAEMPKPPDYQRRVWDALTSEQQGALRERIADLEKRMQQQRRRNGARGSEPRPPLSDDRMTSDAPMRGGSEPAMTPDRGDVTVPARAEGEAAGRRRQAARGAGLDDMARKRLEFLRQFVSRSSPSRATAGDGPTLEQRTFTFEEER
jgi:hypothetical protein